MKLITTTFKQIGFFLFLNTIAFAQNECVFDSLDVRLEDPYELTGCWVRSLYCNFDNAENASFDVIWRVNSSEITRQYGVVPPFTCDNCVFATEDTGFMNFSAGMLAVNTNDSCCRVMSSFQGKTLDTNVELCEVQVVSKVNPILEPDDLTVSRNLIFLNEEEFMINVKLDDYPIFFFQNFKVWMNNEFLGDYQLPDDSEFTIGPFELSTEIDYQLEIGTSCENDEKLIYPIEIISLCNFYNVSMVNKCQENEQFFTQLSFEYINVSNDSFAILSDEINYGTFSYQELQDTGYVTIGPFEGDGESIYELQIGDADNINCFLDFEVQAPNCYLENCSIRNIKPSVSAWGGHCEDVSLSCSISNYRRYNILWRRTADGQVIEIDRASNQTTPFTKQDDFAVEGSLYGNFYKLLAVQAQDPCCFFSVDFSIYEGLGGACNAGYKIKESVGYNFNNLEIDYEIEHVNEEEFVINFDIGNIDTSTTYTYQSDLDRLPLLLFYGYDIFVNGEEQQGNFRFPEDLFVTLGPFSADGTDYEVEFSPLCYDENRSQTINLGKICSETNPTPPCTATDLKEISDLDIKIVQLHNSLVLSNLKNVAVVELFDLNGRKIFEKNVKNTIDENVLISNDNLPKGIYVLQIVTNNSQKWSKKIFF